MADFKVLLRKSVDTLSTDGIKGFAKKTKGYLVKKQIEKEQSEEDVFFDVLFINGCGPAVPHPPRYRVTHQREQLLANNITSSEVFYENLDVDQVRLYRTFVFFRCPYTDTVGKFIKEAKRLHKKVLFDIDDLVVDTKYTDKIQYLATLSDSERTLYEDGVMRMGKTLKLCDGAITTTERLAEELSHYVPEVFINRNTASEEMLELSEKAYRDTKLEKETSNKVKIGYFSGSLTHNDDFILILPAVQAVMKKYNNVELHIVGELYLPPELEAFKERVIAHPFVDWKKLPELISKVDINLAPLENSIFNEAKSENKWVEAALVRVPTIASNVGAFAQMIKNQETGLLCDSIEEWNFALEQLITNSEERCTIAERAYNYCSRYCTTIYTGKPLSNFVKEYMTENLAIFLPSLEISGGIMVALKHATILMDAGYDVSLVNVNDKIKWCEFENYKLPVLSQEAGRMCGRFDKAVATMWTTVSCISNYPNIKERYYLVQGFETNFYEPNVPLRIMANLSYSPVVPIQFITISKWCQKWLREDFEQSAKYAPNGIYREKFPLADRDFSGKIRILIEGDCEMYYKNIDESFRIVDQLDKEKFEIWYMSYNAKPKPHYRVDRFLHKIPHDQVSEVYQQCHILLKTSLLDSFSYPPLEMMSTGGYSVVVPNDGNQEYLVHEGNCLLYPAGDIQKGVEAVLRICSDESLRKVLLEGGIKTAESRDWSNIKKDILDLYI